MADTVGTVVWGKWIAVGTGRAAFTVLDRGTPGGSWLQGQTKEWGGTLAVNTLRSTFMFLILWPSQIFLEVLPCAVLSHWSDVEGGTATLLCSPPIISYANMGTSFTLTFSADHFPASATIVKNSGK